MDMYIRMYDELKKGNDDNPTIGIVLCSDTDSDIAKYSILHGNEQLFASKYKLYLPSEEELRKEIETQKARLERAKLAYVDGAFSLDDYKEKAKQIEDTIEMLQDKINTADKCDTFTYSAKDILVARDIAFINKGVHPEEYDDLVVKIGQMKTKTEFKYRIICLGVSTLAMIVWTATIVLGMIN